MRVSPTPLGHDFLGVSPTHTCAEACLPPDPVQRSAYDSPVCSASHLVATFLALSYPPCFLKEIVW